MPKVELIALEASGLGPIDHGAIEFGPGFNALTGETGAGKTLLVGALSLCLGSGDTRGSRSDDSLRVATVFRTAEGEVALAREQVAGGRLRSSVDGRATSSEELRTRGDSLLVIHGQHDSLRLRARSELVRLVDRHGGIDDEPLRDIRRRIGDLERERDLRGTDPVKWEQDLDFRRFQLAEIDRVAPTSPDELRDSLERLEGLSSILDNLGVVNDAIESLDGDGDHAALQRVAASAHSLPTEGELSVYRERLLSLVLEAREVVRELSAAAAQFEADPEEMDRLNERVSVLRALSRKHGSALEDVFAARDRLEREITDALALAGSVAELDEELTALRRDESLLAEEFRRQRGASALSLAAAVTEQFPRVALNGADLSISVDGRDGSEIDFVFAPGPGRPGGPLRAIASGGELSRVLLALSLVSVPDDVVAVFDEVDAGIGGSVAQQIGDCLHELSRQQQVIVVTHLASVAARADRHFVVRKAVTDGKTTTTVDEVRGDTRVSEIARMLAGDSAGAESRALAARLLSGL